MMLLYSLVQSCKIESCIFLLKLNLDIASTEPKTSRLSESSTSSGSSSSSSSGSSSGSSSDTSSDSEKDGEQSFFFFFIMSFWFLCGVEIF